MLQGSGTGTFTNVATDYVGVGPAGMAANGFNSDGRPDAATTDNGTGTLGVMLNQGAGKVVAGEYRGLLTISSAATAPAIRAAW